jgi:hypothetical protein
VIYTCKYSCQKCLSIIIDQSENSLSKTPKVASSNRGGGNYTLCFRFELKLSFRGLFSFYNVKLISKLNFKILLYMSSRIHHQISRLYHSIYTCIIEKGVASNQHWWMRRTVSFVVLILAVHN